MSDTFSHFILHFDRYFILSRQSVFIIQWSAACLAVLYALTFHPKISRQAMMFYAGFLLRAILLTGITIELIHQVRITHFTAGYLTSQGSELLPILHLLMYGYVLLTAFHYMLLPQEQKGKGIFYTFDLTVVTMPVIQVIFSFFSYWRHNPEYISKTEIYEALCFAVIILLLLISMNFLFFKMYWKPKAVFIGLFYAAVIGLMVFVLVPYPDDTTKDYGRLFLYTTYLTMAGFLMSHHLFHRSKRISCRVKTALAAAIAVCFIVFLNPLYNAGDAAFAISKPIAADSVDYVGEHITSEKAEQIVTSFFPAKEPIYLAGTDQDLHYFYRFKTKDYEADVDEVSQMIQDYNCLKKPEGRILTEKEYRKKSLEFLSAHGRKLDTDRIKTKVRKENQQIVVEIIPKKMDIHHEQRGAVFYWEKETIMSFSENPSIYKLESLPQVHMSQKEIINKTKAVSRTLQMSDQAFDITNININSVIGSSLTVTAKNGAELEFDTESGRLFKIRLPDGKSSLTKAELQKKLFSLLGADMSELKQDNKLKDGFVFQDAGGKHTITLQNDEGITEVSLDDRGMAKTFPHTYEEGKKAFRKAAAKYNGVIYKKRVKPVTAAKDGVRYDAWLVIIQPFGSNRHDAYVVNADTYKAVNLYEQ
ncbi:hypothetical protein J7E26_06025 [Bacillus sp. ISL-51]|uniref:hypothetical protein n=1 Tax=Bacteria TaxID=2 RepID=UPI001BED2FBE|nr:MULTISPECIES: hypothetical protein [Bacteria]MBT2573507.1 hypothetical protein [Bacillus sp. ISL-51]MBT2633771.1 hypothetical protein [Bacillus sp. ISL-26]MBT2712639.1 hypothetical protein [Pseudomonas sp. ISL-88]